MMNTRKALPIFHLTVAAFITLLQQQLQEMSEFGQQLFDAEVQIIRTGTAVELGCTHTRHMRTISRDLVILRFLHRCKGEIHSRRTLHFEVRKAPPELTVFKA